LGEISLLSSGDRESHSYRHCGANTTISLNPDVETLMRSLGLTITLKHAREKFVALVARFPRE
jgi:hypothetical protein